MYCEAQISRKIWSGTDFRTWKINVAATVTVLLIIAPAQAADTPHAFFTTSGILEVKDPDTYDTSYDVSFDASCSYGSVTYTYPNLDDPQGECSADVNMWYSWDFGDGEKLFGYGADAADVILPTHKYSRQDNYVVTLTVSTYDGEKEIISNTVTSYVSVNIPANETVGGIDGNPLIVNNGPFYGVPGEEIVFDATGTSDDNGVLVGWNYGDGCSQKQDYFLIGDTTNPKTEYIVYDGDGKVQTKSRRVFDPGQFAYIYEYYNEVIAGTNCKSSGFYTTHRYSKAGKYDVLLSVYERRPDLDLDSFYPVWVLWTDVVTAIVNSKPVAKAKIQSVAAINENVAFVGEESVDSDEQSLSYYWDFGDGTSSTENNPSHAYTEPGVYVVRFSVNDGIESSSEIVREINVHSYAWLIPIMSLLL